jgi:hypothetical protein
MESPVAKVGEDVFYRLPNDTRSPGEQRPAKVVKVWGDHPGAAINLVVFVDGSNDGFDTHTIWRTSVVPGDQPGQWQYDSDG